MENDLGLLVALVTINDSTPIAEQTMLDATLFILSGITIGKANKSALSKRTTWNFPSVIWCSNLKT